MERILTPFSDNNFTSSLLQCISFKSLFWSRISFHNFVISWNIFQRWDGGEHRRRDSGYEMVVVSTDGLAAKTVWRRAQTTWWQIQVCRGEHKQRGGEEGVVVSTDDMMADMLWWAQTAWRRRGCGGEHRRRGDRWRIYMADEWWLEWRERRGMKKMKGFEFLLKYL
jgi:hypothetical protein